MQKRAENIKQTVKMKHFCKLIAIVSLWTANVYSLEVTFLQLALEMQKHSDVYIISDNFTQLTAGARSLIQNYQISTDDVTHFRVERYKFNENQTLSSKVLLSLSTEETTLDIVRQIGNSVQFRRDQTQLWILILWPRLLTSENDIQPIFANRNLTEVMKSYEINSEVFIAFRKSGPIVENIFANYYFHEVYTINNQLINRPVFDLGQVLAQCPECPSATLRRFNFQGLLLRVMGIESETDVSDDVIFGRKDGELFFKGGYSTGILGILTRSLNFTVKAIKAETWGEYFLNNNSWTGATKDVADGIADMCISVTVMLPHRAQLITFLPPTDENMYSIIPFHISYEIDDVSAFFRTPDLNAIRDIFAQPFQPDLWAAVFATWLVLAFSMILFSVIHRRYKVGDGTTEEPDFTQDSLIWALATACQQGWDEHPYAGSLRTIFISGSFTGVVAYAGYSAAIVSTLSLRIDPIQSPNALLESNLHLGLRQGGFISDLVNMEQTTTDDIISSFYRKAQMTKEEQREMNTTTAYKHIMNAPFAFLSLKDAFYDAVKSSKDDTELCTIKEMSLLKTHFPAAPFLPKRSPYLEFIRYALITIREPGLFWRLRSEFAYTRRCLEAADNQGRALGATDVFTAFMILIAGYLLSTSLLIFEKLFRASKLTYIQ